MKVRPSRTVRLFEALILRPFSIAFPILAVACLAYAHWIAGVTMSICWFLVGAIGQSLPHRKPETFSELTTGETLPPNDDVISNEDAFALAKATMRLGATVGFAAMVLALTGGLRWHWIIVATSGGYLVTAMAAGMLPPLLAARKAKPVKQRSFKKLSDEDWQVVAREFKRVHQPDEAEK